MKIVVCVKQVPRLDEIRFDRANRVVREDVASMVNPADWVALGHALALRTEAGGEVVAITMGPPSAREALEEVMARGADRAVHLCDKRFAGSDTLATARALARAVSREEADLVVLGRNTLDGATAQLAPQLAEELHLPHLTEATELTLDDGALEVVRETDRGWERWDVPLPAVLSVARGPHPDRDGDEDGGSSGGEIETLDMEALGGEPADYGTRGSPTFVREVRQREIARDGERTDDRDEAAGRIRRLAEEARARDSERRARVPDPPDEAERAIWVLAEREGERLHPVSLEGLACAAQLSERLDARIVSVLLCDDAGDLPRVLAEHGAHRVLVVRHDALADYASEPFTAALCAAIENDPPFALIAGWTAQGRDFVPRVAARLELGLTGDFIGLEIEDSDKGRLLWMKPAWAGTVDAAIIARSTPGIGTLRPGALRPPRPREETPGDVPIDHFEPELDLHGGGPVRRDRRDELDGPPPLDHSPVVFLLGPELDGQGAETARRVATSLEAGVGGTSGAVESGLVPGHLEVGVLRRSIAPQLCVAIGVGQAEDLDPVRAAATIVTVHPDADAQAHERADLAVLCAPADLLAALEEASGRQ